VHDVNQTILKIIVLLSYDVFALEALNPAYMRENGYSRRFRSMLGSWSPSELQSFIEYKAKDAGKYLIYINPKHKSQKCSRCGYIDKNNRHGSVFRCKNCVFELHADLNASRNIEVLNKSEYFRLFSASQSLRFNETPLTGGGETSNKLLSFSEE